MDDMSPPTPSMLRRVAAWLRRAGRAVLPGWRAWTGAALGMLIAALLLIIPANLAYNTVVAT